MERTDTQISLPGSFRLAKYGRVWGNSSAIILGCCLLVALLSDQTEALACSIFKFWWGAYGIALFQLLWLVGLSDRSDRIFHFTVRSLLFFEKLLKPGNMIVQETLLVCKSTVYLYGFLVQCYFYFTLLPI